jgi:hypothetical protein
MDWLWTDTSLLTCLTVSSISGIVCSVGTKGSRVRVFSARTAISKSVRCSSIASVFHGQNDDVSIGLKVDECN